MVNALTRPSSLKPTTRPVPALDFWTWRHERRHDGARALRWDAISDCHWP
jgi:hypothetical protein